MAALVGDVGGTKTRLALFEGLTRVHFQEYASRDYGDLAPMILQFLQTFPSPRPERACLGVPGPVGEGVCYTTNLPWKIQAADLSAQLDIAPFLLINDLEAHAYAVPLLSSRDWHPLHEGTEKPHNTIALIAAGTGLGEAALLYASDRWVSLPSEGGHADFACTREEDLALWKYLHRKYGHVSYERILSGHGLSDLYRFFIEKGVGEKDDSLREGDVSRAIIDKALHRACIACVCALEKFAFIYGSEGGNLALKFLSCGGIYIAGGIAPKIIRFLEQEWMRGFTAKGRFEKFLQNIPVKVIMSDRAALLGAAFYAYAKA
jgi:glucokinase